MMVELWYSPREQPFDPQRGMRDVTSRWDAPNGADEPSTEAGPPGSFKAAHTANWPACPVSSVWLNPKIRDFGVANGPRIQFATVIDPPPTGV
jgi:hypothetical protein